MHEMKKSFLNEIHYLFPGGLNWDTMKRQHRDIIHIYSMGWIEALLKHGNDAAVRSAAEFCKPMTDPNWWPDDSWRW